MATSSEIFCFGTYDRYGSAVYDPCKYLHFMRFLSSFFQEFKESDYKSEMELILCCARNSVNRDKILNLLDKNIDWNYIFKTAAYHGLIPLLYKNLKFVNSSSIPNEVLEYLHDASYVIAFRNTSLLRDLIQILKILENHGIDAISFKGPVLAILVYGSLSLRTFCDLDILVRKKDFLKACNILTEIGGYYPCYSLNFIDKNLERSVLESSSEYSLTNGNTYIDLHQVLTVEIFLSSGFTFNYLWNRCESIEISGQSIPIFGKEDLLMYLCIHGSKDCWRSLKWICDISEFVNRYPDINWDSLLSQAKILGCEKMLLLGLSLAHEMLEINLPDIVALRFEEHKSIRRMSEKFSNKIFYPDKTLGRNITFNKLNIHWKMIEKPMDKFYFIKDIGRHFRHIFISYLVPRREDKIISLPEYLYFIYFFVRPFRLVNKRFFGGN